MKKIYILDGSGFIYRARHAYPPMMNASGQSVHMIYGLYRMLIKLLSEKPDNLVIVRDAKGKTVRHEAFPSYKGNRPAMPDDFSLQVAECKSLANELGIPNVEKLGYEADDILFTMCKRKAKKAKSNGELRTDNGELYVVYTGDKDIKQILEFPNVIIRDQIKDEEWTKEKFIKDFGFEPHQIIDYLSIIGDASDNVPGARGIGPKGASDLIQKHGTIELIYDKLNSPDSGISDKTRQLLLDSKDQVLQAKKLISLLEVPDLEIDELVSYKPDIDLRRTTFVQKYGFPSFTKILDELKKQLYFSSDGGLF